MTAARTTTTTKTLAEALVALQAAAPKLKTDSVAKVPTKGGGEYSYKYLTLNSLTDDMRPVLAEHDFAWVTMPAGSTAEPTLRYALIHGPSGDKIEGEVPLYLGGSPTAQAHGSAITYARRYALLAVLGLCAEDDDGKGASVPHGRRDERPQAQPMSEEDRDSFWTELQSIGADAPLILASVGMSTKLAEWNAADGPKLRAAIDDYTAQKIAKKFNGHVETGVEA